MSNYLSVLAPTQYTLVLYAFLITAVFMAGCAIFFVASRHKVEPDYRPALWISAAIALLAALHYAFLFTLWRDVYELQGTFYQLTETVRFALHRYLLWLPTVPMLLISLVVVLGLPARQARSLSVRLSLATVAMIALGYPGELAESMQARAIWGSASTVPFLYILWKLFQLLDSAAVVLPERVRLLVNNSVLLIFGSWGFFPVVYVLPMFGVTGMMSEVWIQLGYVLATWVGKAGLGFLVYAIAREQSLAEEEYEYGDMKSTMEVIESTAKTLWQ